MGVSLKLSVSVTYDSATEATVKAVLKATTSGASYNNSGPSGWIKIDGTKYRFSHNIPKSSTTTLATKSKKIGRTTSNKSISVSASFSTGISAGTLTKSTSTTVSARPNYTVTFNANGGTGGGSVAVFHGYTTTFPYTSRTGYNFVSWDGYGQGAATPAITSARTYTASWSIQTYGVTLDAQGGSIQQTYFTKTYGSDLNLSAANPTRTGYDFGGWCTGVNGTGTNYGTTYTGDTAITLYAKWTIKSYAVTLESIVPFPDDSNIYERVLTKYYDQPLALPDWGSEVVEGKLFGGWQTKENGNGANSTSWGVTYTANESTTLEAVWSNRVRPVILHYYNSATNIESTYSLNKVEGQLLQLPMQLTITNYAFENWWTGPDAKQGSVITNGILDNSIDPIDYENVEPYHVYGEWTKTYIIEFRPNTPIYNDGIEVTGSISPMVVKDNQTYMLPSLSNYSYQQGDGTDRFKCSPIGWALSSNGSKAYDDEQEITLTGQVPGYKLELYVLWAPNKFTVTLKSNIGEEDVLIENLDYYSTYTLPGEVWDVEDQHIINWLLNLNTYSIGQEVLIAGNQEYTAQWEENYHAAVLDMTIDRFADEACTTPSAGGKYVQVKIKGTNGYYTGATPTEQSGEIEVKFLDDTNNNAGIFKKTIKTVNGVVDYTEVFYDKIFNYFLSDVVFKDTTDYNGRFDPDDVRRNFVTKFIVPLKRAIAMHIADDVSAISMFEELEEGDRGLVVHGSATADVLTGLQRVQIGNFVDKTLQIGMWSWEAYEDGRLRLIRYEGD